MNQDEEAGAAFQAAPAGATVMEALEHIAIWMQAVQLQRLRLTSGQPWPANGPLSRQADCWMFIMALSRLRHSTKLLRRVAPPDRHGAIDEAVQVFDANPSGAATTIIRDVLEHAEDYLLGTGKLQKSWTGGAPRLLEWHVSEENSHVIHLGGISPGRVVVAVDVEEASAAADVLRGSLADAVRP